MGLENPRLFTSTFISRLNEFNIYNSFCYPLIIIRIIDLVRNRFLKQKSESGIPPRFNKSLLFQFDKQNDFSLSC